MFLERLTLSGFRCFGPEPQSIPFDPSITAFVGLNGSGKTAVMQALLRLFGVTEPHRRVRTQDFHVSSAEENTPAERTLFIEAILTFPELDGDGAGSAAVPEFFHHMATDDEGRLKCRLRLDATWADDGSLDGAIVQRVVAVRTFGPFTETECTELRPIDRARIQMIYVPAVRDAASQVTAFLRGRLWRAIAWSPALTDTITESAVQLNAAFGEEPSIAAISTAVEKRWRQVHSASTDTTPVFRPVDLRFQEFVRKVEIVFTPDESGGDRALDDLSEGQRSLFHLSMTAAALDVEAKIAAGAAEAGFQPGGVPLPALTLIAVEEPENSLAPFFLSRIIQQLKDLTETTRAQAVVSSHSAGILGRVDPSQVRHFRLDVPSRASKINSIRLPDGPEEASKFVREAVRIYPELYFARYVVLGEGASEEVVLPRIAEAFGVVIDPSFVALVPLGGRHVNHLWRLLTDLSIPFATLLDLDLGRSGGGWGRIKSACEQLLAIGVAPDALFGAALHAQGPSHNLEAFDACDPADNEGMQSWLTKLRDYGVFFSTPLDLDYTMLRAFPDAYTKLEDGMQGPSAQGDPRTSILGEEGQPELYGEDHTDALRWYRYLFLGRSKPSSHLRVTSRIGLDVLQGNCPEVIRCIVERIRAHLEESPTGDEG